MTSVLPFMYEVIQDREPLTPELIECEHLSLGTQEHKEMQSCEKMNTLYFQGKCLSFFLGETVFCFIFKGSMT